jgi:hypothetical protein
MQKQASVIWLLVFRADFSLSLEISNGYAIRFCLVY